MYNSYFDEQIRKRGFKYYKYGNVSNIVVDKNIVTSNVLGNDNIYDIKVVFNEFDDKKIDSAKCNCPYFLDKYRFCKHIYATILSVKYDEEKEKKENLQDEIELRNKKNECAKCIKSCEKILKKLKRKLIFNYIYLEKYIFKDYLKNYKIYKRSLQQDIELVNKNSKYTSYYQHRLKTLKNIYKNANDDLNKITKDIKKEKIIQVDSHSKGRISLFSEIFASISAQTPNEENELKIGDWVEITSYGQEGEIIEIHGDEYYVEIDNGRGTVDYFKANELKK